MRLFLVSLLAVFAVSCGSAKSTVVVIDTSLGNIEVELFEKAAPLTVANFLSYVDEGYYNGTIFHRVINNFMIQAGGHTADLARKPAKPPIKNECMNGLRNEIGTVGMARLPEFDSATSQFYINVANNVNSDGKYCVFGKVTKGMDTVNKIKAVRTGTVSPIVDGVKSPMSDVPLEIVTIRSITRK